MLELTRCVADRREFLRISQAVGMGFLIMGVIGYIVKLSTHPPFPVRLGGYIVDEFVSCSSYPREQHFGRWCIDVKESKYEGALGNACQRAEEAERYLVGWRKAEQDHNLAAASFRTDMSQYLA